MFKFCNLSFFILEYGCWNVVIEIFFLLDFYVGVCLCGFGFYLIGVEIGICLLVVVNGY